MRHRRGARNLLERSGDSMAYKGIFRIVVGVDGSAQSRAALDWAIEEAKLRRGRCWPSPRGTSHTSAVP